MTTEQIIDNIVARKAGLGMTNQQLADASNVPKSTVDKILRREIQNPSMQTILNLAHAVGYDHAHADEHSPMNDPTIQYALGQHNKLEAQLERRGNRLSVAVIVLAVVLFLVLVAVAWVLYYDLTHPTVGWFQY